MKEKIQIEEEDVDPSPNVTNEIEMPIDKLSCASDKSFVEVSISIEDDKK